jgi:hypothetical protein
VDFAILRAALSVVKVVRDLDVSLTDPNKEGECHCKCPKCLKERSFSLNINSNWFNYFAKGCTLKGGIFTQCVSEPLNIYRFHANKKHTVEIIELEICLTNTYL